MADDDELLLAIRASAKRQSAVVVRPLDGDARAGIARSIAASYGPSRARARRAFRGRAAALVSGLALAATLVLVMRPARAPGELPSYALVVSGGARDVRGDGPTPNEGALRLRKKDRFEVVLRPAAAAPAPVAAQAFLIVGGTRIPFAGSADIAPNGSIRIAGSVEDFPGAPTGPGELVIAIGRAGAMPADADALSLGGRGDGALRILRTPVTVE